MGKILITGINGYVGRTLAVRLARAGHDISGVSLENTYAQPDANIDYVQSDITDSKSMQSLFDSRTLDAVIHLAALVHVRSADLSFLDYARVNYRASEGIFRLAAKHRISRVMFASTIEVYGPTARGAIVTEEAPCKPESDYARTKLLAEQSLTSMAEKAGLSYAITRFAPVYGPGFRLNIDKRLYLRRYDIAYLVGGGHYGLHFCAVQNIARFVERWLAQEAPQSGIYNIADDGPQKVRDLLRFERSQGRARVTLNVPYVPSLVGAAIWQTSNAVLRRSGGTISLENVRKLVQSAVWDNSKARKVAGAMPPAFELLDSIPNSSTD